jgi:hypothetical protein
MTTSIADLCGHDSPARPLPSLPGSVRQALAWPLGKFTVYDMPDEHEPCYLVCPDGLMIPFNAHATNGVDQARAQWFANTLNAALNAISNSHAD